MTRKKFFNALGTLSIAALAVLWYRMAARSRELNGNSAEIKIPGDIAPGITIIEGCILVKDSNSLKAFSTQCTHAGCIISHFEGDVLKCPCHGSEFDATTGKPLKGPAIKPLKPFECRYENKTGVWIIRRG